MRTNRRLAAIVLSAAAAHAGEEKEAPRPGEIFRQADLKRTLEALVDAEAKALAEGKSRKQAIYAAYDLFYKGDIAREFVRGSQEQGGLHTQEDPFSASQQALPVHLFHISL